MMRRKKTIISELILLILFAVCLPGLGQEAEGENYAIEILHSDGKDAEAFVRSRRVAVGRMGEMQEKDGVLVCEIHMPSYNFSYGGAFIETFKIIKPADEDLVSRIKKHSVVLLIKSLKKPIHWQLAGIEVPFAKETKQDKLSRWLPGSFYEKSEHDRLLENSKYRYEGYVDDKFELLKSSDDPSVRSSAIFMLGVIEPDTAEAIRVIDKLAELLNGKVRSDWPMAARMIGRIGGQHAQRCVPRISQLLYSQGADDKHAAIESICLIGGREAQKHIPRILELGQNESGLGCGYASLLGTMGGQASSALPALLDGLKALDLEHLKPGDNSKRSEMSTIFTALGRIGPRDPKVIKALTPLLDHANTDVRQFSKRALSGRDFTRPAPKNPDRGIK